MIQERTFYNQPVRSLQWMLRTIAQSGESLDLLIPSGIYDPPTQAAVSQFQRNHGLPVTGVTNRQTWKEIVRVYDDALILAAPAQSILVDVQAVFPPEPGRYSPYLHLAQTMMHFLAEEYHSILRPEQTGYMTRTTEDALSDFQQLSGLPMTGVLDKPTWKHLTLQYSTAVAKNGFGAKESPSKIVYKELDK